MKIAFASDNGRDVSAHFGRCKSFIVLTVEEGKVASREVRQARERSEHGENRRACRGDVCECLDNPEQGHQGLLDLIKDCKAVVCLGLGPKAANALKASGIRPIVLSGPMDPEEAALVVVSGRVRTDTPGKSGCCHQTR